MRHQSRNRWFVVAVFFVFMLLHQSDRLLIGTLTTNIMATFRITMTQMGAVSTGALIVGALCYPLWGYLYDRYGRAKLLALASFIWGATTWLNAIAPTYKAFLVTRATTGIDDSSYPGIYSLISDLFGPKVRGKVYGLLQLTAPLGFLLGMILALALAGCDRLAGCVLHHRQPWRDPGGGDLLRRAGAAAGGAEPEMAGLETVTTYRFKWPIVWGLVQETHPAPDLRPGFLRGFSLECDHVLVFCLSGKGTGLHRHAAVRDHGRGGDRVGRGLSRGRRARRPALPAHPRGRAIVSTIGVLAGAVLLWLTLSVPVANQWLFLVMLAFTALFIPFAAPNVVSTVYDITLPEVRSTALSIESLIESAGAALSPLIAGFIADRSSLGTAILLICVSTWLLCALFFIGVAIVVPGDIRTLRTQMRGARRGRAGLAESGALRTLRCSGAGKAFLKIAILGAGGVRTPLIVGAMLRRAARLGLTELALMDVDAERLDIIGMLAQAQQDSPDGTSRGRARRRRSGSSARPTRALRWPAQISSSPLSAWAGSPRAWWMSVCRCATAVLGQETTGPGGFAMAMRTIPVLLDYLATMREVCPDAWLINFANPAGLLAEAAITAGDWARTVGICDAPEGMRRVAAALFGMTPDELYLDYFGLNHLGWVRGAFQGGQDLLPRFIAMLRVAGRMPGLPFDAEFITSLGMIPNEYLFYYYHSREAVDNILRDGQTRGEQIAGWNALLFDELKSLRAAGDLDGMRRTYQAYLEQRGGTYMASETGQTHDLAGLDPAIIRALAGEGYAGIALDLIEGLSGGGPRQMILNVPNAGAIRGMAARDVVEVPVFVGKGVVRPLAVGEVPGGPLGLMQQVKAYEQLTIAAATEGSYAKAVQALTIHPLVQDYAVAVAILEGYREGHGASFPALK